MALTVKNSDSPEGSHQNFADLLAAHQPRLAAYIRSLTADEQVSRDILQETNVTLLKKSRDFQPGTNFTAWSFRVAYFEVLTWRRGKGRERLHFNDELVESIAVSSEKASTSYDERLDLLKGVHPAAPRSPARDYPAPLPQCRIGSGYSCGPGLQSQCRIATSSSCPDQPSQVYQPEHSFYYRVLTRIDFLPTAMNFDSDSFEELTALAGRMLDGDLPPDELARLTELITASEEAHEAFVQLCELHSMLEAEPAIRESISADQRPENVVSLPGTKPVSLELVSPMPSPSRWKLALLATAAVVVASVLIIANRDNEPGPPLSDCLLYTSPSPRDAS